MSETNASAIFGHCCTIYNKMLELSVEESNLEGFTGKVYRGHLTHLFNEANVSLPYYTTIMNILKKMDCVTQLRRGGGTASSVWAILQPPVVETFNSLVEGKTLKNSAKQPVSQVLQQQIRDLHATVSRLSQEVELLRAVVLGNRDNRSNFNEHGDGR